MAAPQTGALAASVPEVRVAANVNDASLWFRAIKSGAVPTWGFSVDLRGGSHVKEHGSGLGTYYESQLAWDAEDSDVRCVEADFKVHDAHELQENSASNAQASTPPIQPIQWHTRGASVRPHAPIEIGVPDLELAATPLSEKAATRTVQGALETVGAANAAAALRRLQLRALPTTFPFMAIKPASASLFGRPCLSLRQARKISAEPAFVQQLQAQIQRGVFLLLSSIGMKEFLLEELVVLNAQTELEILAEVATLRPLHRRYLFSIDIGFQHEGSPQQVNLFVDNWQYYAWRDVQQSSSQEFRRHEYGRANNTAERILRQVRQVNGDPQVPHLIAICILLIAPAAPSLSALSSAVVELLFKHMERVRGGPLAASPAAVFVKLDSARSGSITALRLAEYVQEQGAAFTVADLRRLASTPYEGPLVRVAEVGKELFFSFNPLTVTLARYELQPTTDEERAKPAEVHSLAEYTVEKVTEQVFSLVHESHSQPTFTFTCPDRPATHWIAIIASALTQFNKQRTQESIAKAVLSAAHDALYGLF